MTEPTPKELVATFIKNETFYAVILLLVVVALGAQTYYQFAQSDKIVLDRATAVHEIGITEMEKLWAELPNRDPVAHPFAMSVFQLNRILLILGILLIGLSALVWVVRGRLLQRHELRIPVWGLWDVLKVAGMFAAGSIAFGLVFGAHRQGPTGPAFGLAQVFAGILAVGVMIHVVVIERGGQLRDLGLRCAGLREAMALGFLGLAFVLPFMELIHRMELEAVKRGFIPEITIQRSVQTLLLTRSNLALILGTLVAVLVAPVVEELLFRGLLLPALQRWVGHTVSIVLSALFFAAGHIDLFVFLPMLAMGLVMGYLYDRTRSIAAPLTMHITYNLLVMLGLFAHRSLLWSSS